MITTHRILSGHWSTYDRYVRDRMEAAVRNGGTYEMHHSFDGTLTFMEVTIYETAEDLISYEEGS